jgi:hypothetical protein
MRRVAIAAAVVVVGCAVSRPWDNSSGRKWAAASGDVPCARAEIVVSDFERGTKREDPKYTWRAYCRDRVYKCMRAGGLIRCHDAGPAPSNYLELKPIETSTAGH